jgi:hypothetical protein
MEIQDSAISHAASQLREVLPPEILSAATFVPVRPSHAKTDPLYDDRIIRILQQLGDEVDVKELATQTDS